MPFTTFCPSGNFSALQTSKKKDLGMAQGLICRPSNRRSEMTSDLQSQEIRKLHRMLKLVEIILQRPFNSEQLCAVSRTASLGESLKRVS